MKENNTLYIAYGSNLNLLQMSIRCPTAKVVGKSEIRDYELLFRSGQSAVATVEPLHGGHVPILLWDLKGKDLLALDHYEGYPQLYRKEMFDVELNGTKTPALVYVMNEGHPFGQPSEYYFNTIMEGYKSAGFNPHILMDAADRSQQLAAEQTPDQGSLFGMKWW
jgi:gamma-glutamylcyclotransferase (GGCT)/AIG2-like uncharacterized protein YtfP